MNIPTAEEVRSELVAVRDRANIRIFDLEAERDELLGLVTRTNAAIRAFDGGSATSEGPCNVCGDTERPKDTEEPHGLVLCTDEVACVETPAATTPALVATPAVAIAPEPVASPFVTPGEGSRIGVTKVFPGTPIELADVPPTVHTGGLLRPSKTSAALVSLDHNEMAISKAPTAPPTKPAPRQGTKTVRDWVVSLQPGHSFQAADVFRATGVRAGVARILRPLIAEGRLSSHGSRSQRTYVVPGAKRKRGKKQKQEKPKASWANMPELERGLRDLFGGQPLSKKVVLGWAAEHGVPKNFDGIVERLRANGATFDGVRLTVPRRGR